MIAIFVAGMPFGRTQKLFQGRVGPDIKNQMGANLFSVNGRVETLIVERPRFPDTKMDRAARRQKKGTVVCDNWNVNAERFFPLRRPIEMRV